jgi:Cu(I)/Ag(I) efflux system membrane fusion protein
MALVKKGTEKALSTEELTHLQEISLSPTQRVLANISTIPATGGTLNKEITLVGIVEPSEARTATVSARFRGRIERLFVSTTGAEVQEGQALFSLYSPDLVTSQQEFILALEAQPQLVAGIRERLRLHYGMTEEMISTVEQSRTIQTTVVFHSPIRGTVIRRDLKPGQYVDEGTGLYQLADLSSVWIMLDVYERDLPLIRVGQRVYISTESLPEDEFSGRVTFIDPVMNPATRTARIRTEFSNLLGKLKPQMYVTARVALPSTEGLLVPSGAVQSTGKRTLVWIETRPNVFEPRDVVIGMSTESFVEVLNGLKEGDRVAATGGFLIDSESSLQTSGTSGHSGHASSTPAGVSMETHTVPSSSAATSPDTVTIVVKGRYTPDVIRVKAGARITLNFQRDEKARCTEEVVFEELGIRRHLPSFATTSITIPPQKPGTIHFACGMSMVHGTLIVEP